MVTIPAAIRPRGFSLEFKVVVFVGAILTLGFSVIYPIVLLFINSFVTTNPPLPAEYGLDSWRFALSDRGMLIALWNSVVVTFLRQGISFPVAILLAWLIARTNLPGAKWLEFGFWIAFFLPVVSVTQAWILLAHPSAGLLNETLEYLPFIDEGPFNIYSLWGIIWVHLATNSIAIKVMLLTPAFRNMDAALEDASRLCGASALGTLRRVTVPVMAPIMMTLLLLSILRAFQSVEIEVLLGLPFRYFVFGSKIFDLVQNEPPDFGAATAMGIIILIAIIPLIMGQYYMTSRRNYTTLSGKYQAQVNDLRKWKWPVFGFVLFLVFLMTIFPMIFLVMGSFMKFSGFFYGVPGGPWTTLHWTRILTDSTFLLSMRNTFVMALGAATLSMIFFTVLAYIIVRMKSRLVPILDFLTWMPYVLPGIRPDPCLALDTPWDRRHLPPALRHDLRSHPGVGPQRHHAWRPDSEVQPAADRRRAGRGLLRGGSAVDRHLRQGRSPAHGAGYGGGLGAQLRFRGRHCHPSCTARLCEQQDPGAAPVRTGNVGAPGGRLDRGHLRRAADGRRCHRGAGPRFPGRPRQRHSSQLTGALADAR